MKQDLWFYERKDGVYYSTSKEKIFRLFKNGKIHASTRIYHPQIGNCQLWQAPEFSFLKEKIWFYENKDGVHAATEEDLQYLYETKVISASTRVYHINHRSCLLWQVPGFYYFIQNQNKINNKISKQWMEFTGENENEYAEESLSTRELRKKQPRFWKGFGWSFLLFLLILMPVVAGNLSNSQETKKNTWQNVSNSNKLATSDWQNKNNRSFDQNSSKQNSSEEDFSQQHSSEQVVSDTGMSNFRTFIENSSVSQSAVDVRTLSNRSSNAVILTDRQEGVNLTINGNVVSAPNGCELHNRSESSSGKIVVGNGSNQMEIGGNAMQRLLVYVPGQSIFLETPPILCLSDGSYIFADFSTQNKSFPVTSKNKILSHPTYFTNVANQICAGKTSDLEKVQAVHDWIATNCAYDKDVLIDRSKYVSDDQESFEMRRGICENFTRWTCDLLNASGVDCVMVTGVGLTMDDTDYEQKPNHAWNIVCIDGQWFPMDVTWDCLNIYENGNFQQKGIRQTYFLQPNNINQDHIMISQVSD